MSLFFNKQQQQFLTGTNPTLPTTANYALVSGDPSPILLEDSKTNTNVREASNPNSGSETTLTDAVDPITSTDSLTFSNEVDTQREESSSRTNADGEASEKSISNSNSTIQQLDSKLGSKKFKEAKTVISNQQQHSKQQPHIIRHHAISHTQNLQLIASPATHRPKSAQASTAPTIRACQNASLASTSMNSPKNNVSVSLATSSAKEWSTQALLHAARIIDNTSEEEGNVESGKYQLERIRLIFKEL